MPTITESEELDLAADTLRQSLENGKIPADQIVTAEQTMAEYHERVRREGREPYSALAQQQAADYNRVRGYFKEKPELDPEEAEELDRLTRYSPHAESEKRQMFNVAFFAHADGKTTDEVNLEYPLYKANYVYTRMGRDTATDDEVYLHIQATLQSLDDAAKGGTTAAIEGRGKGIGLDELSAWESQNKAKPGYSEDSRKTFIDAYLTTKEALAPHRAEIQKLASAAEPFNDADTRAWIEKLADLPQRNRTLVTLAALHSAKVRGEQEKGKRGWWLQAGSALERFVTGDTSFQEEGIESVPDDMLTPVTTTVPKITNREDAAKFFKEQESRNRAQVFAARMSMGTAAVGHIPIIGGVEKRLDADESALVRQYKEREREKVNVARQVRQMAHMASPNDSVTASTFGVSMGILGVMGLTRGAAAPVIVQHYTANNYEQLRLEYPDMPIPYARRIALTSGVLEMVPDMVGLKVLNTMPSLRQLVQGGLKREMIGMALLKVGGNYVYQNVQEGVQDVTLPATHALFAAIKKDLPGVDVEREKERYLNTRGDVAVGLLPLTLLGLGAASVRDVAMARAILADNISLGAAGYVEADRIKIIGLAMEGKLEAAQAALQEARGRASREVAAEFEERYRARLGEAQQAQSDGQRLGMVPKIANDGNGYIVSLKNGTAVRAETWGEARQYAEQHLTDVEMQVVDSVARMGEVFMDQKRAGTPEAFAVAPGESRSLEDDVAEHVVSEEQAADAAVVAGQLRGMTREESLAATWHVLGSNRAERRNNVRTMVSTIFRGGNVLTAVEEPIEGRWKSGLDNGRYTREQGLLWVRLAEKATGQKFLSAADAEVLGSADKAPRSLTEAISAIVTADVLGRRKDGTRLPAGLVTEGLNAAVRQAAGVKERGEVVQFGQFLRAWRALFGQVFSRARALNKARAEGRLGEDYEGFLNDLMGVDGSGNSNQDAAIDGTSRSESITELSDGKTTPLTLNPGETLWEENGVTFGVAPVPFAENVEAAVKGRLPANAILDMGRPGEVLRKAGVPDLPMWIRLSKVRKKRGKHSELTEEVLKKFPGAMDNPMLVYVSPGDRKAHSIVTSLATSQGPLTAYFTVHEREGQHVLEAKTLFGKEPGELLAEIREAESLGLITHKNKGAFEAWLAQGDGAFDGTSTQHGPAIEGLKEVFHEADGSQHGESASQLENDTITEPASRGEIDLATFGMVPKMRQDKPGSWEEVKTGHTWDSAKKFLPKLKDSRPAFPEKRGTWEVLVQKVATWLGKTPTIKDPWGAMVATANPQKRGGFRNPLDNRAAHLIGENLNKNEENRTLDPDKLDWIGAVEKTISDAQVRVTNGPETFYFRSYAEGTHMVIVEDGAIKDQYSLVTQYAPELSKRQFRGALVEQVRPVPGLAPQGGPGSVGIPTQPQSQAVQTPRPEAHGDTTTSARESQPVPSPTKTGTGLDDVESYSIVPNESQEIRIAKAVAAPTLDVPDVANWRGIAPRERRDRMKAALQDAREKGPIVNAERGREIHVSKSGLEHWNRYAADPRKASLMGHLRELFQRAIYVRSEKPDSRKNSVPGLQLFHKLALPVRFDGQETMVRLTVHEDANGRWVYDGQVLEVILPVPDTNTPADGPEGVSRHGSNEGAELHGIQQVREKVLREALKVNAELMDETATFSMLPSSPEESGKTRAPQDLESQPTGGGTNIDSNIPIPYVQQHGQGTERRRDAQAALGALLARAEDDDRANAQADAGERLRAESQSVVSWAREDGWLIEPAGFARLTPSFKEFEGGAEHQVFGVREAGRVMKITRPPNFGARGKLADYLRNIKWSNQLFHDDIRIEGIVETTSGPAVVISQPFIAGRSPEVGDVAAWFEQQGFEPTGPNTWTHHKTGAKITDAHPRNFILTSDNVLVPIDLQVLNPGKDVLEQEKNNFEGR